LKLLQSLSLGSVFVCLSASVQFHRGEDFKRACEAAQADNWKGDWATYCFDYVKVLPRNSTAWCIPSQISNQRLATTVLDYLATIREDLTTTAGRIIKIAMIQTFPCD